MRLLCLAGARFARTRAETQLGHRSTGVGRNDVATTAASLTRQQPDRFQNHRRAVALHGSCQLIHFFNQFNRATKSDKTSFHGVHSTQTGGVLQQENEGFQ